MLTNITLFLTLMIPIAWSPGPNNLMCATAGGKGGVAKAIPFVIGINLPILIYALATGFGLAYVVDSFPWMVTLLNYLGGLYVIYLGVGLIRSAKAEDQQKENLGFTQGVVISALNVKVITALIVLYSQFPRFDMNKSLYVLIISTAFVLLCVVGHLLWAVAGRYAATLLASERSQHLQNILYGVMLIIVGGWILAG